MDYISKHIDLLQQEHDIKIIYACEAESKESDYDVKFIYVCKLDYYLSLSDSKPDTIRSLIPSDGNNNSLDMNGWELKKALQLAKKNNASLFEWMTSPIVYHQDPSFSSQLREIIFTFYSKVGLAHHWKSLAKHNIQSYVNVHDMKYKQYLYVIRPLLCIRWLIDNEGNESFPPPQFDKLMNEVTLPDPIRTFINDLIEKKKLGSYLGEGRHSLDLERWFASMMDHDIQSYILSHKKDKIIVGQSLDSLLDSLFYSVVMTYHKEREV